MGNGESRYKLEGDAKRQVQRFDSRELQVIKQTFKCLSHISGDGEERCIDRETFSRYFNLPGLISRRLFSEFGKRNEGFVRYEDFVTTLAVLCHGTWEEKAEFVFKLFDVNNRNTISIHDLSALINHVPKDFIELYWEQPTHGHDRSKSSSMYGTWRRSSDESGERMTNVEKSNKGDHTKSVTFLQDVDGVEFVDDDNKTETECSESVDHRRLSTDECEFKRNTMEKTHSEHTVHSYGLPFTENISQTFRECNFGQNNYLNFAEFKIWLERNPIMIDFLQTVFPYDDNREWDGDDKHLPFVHNRPIRRTSFQSICQDIEDMNEGSSRGLGEGTTQYLTEEETKRLLLHIKRTTANKGIRNEIPKLLALLSVEEDNSVEPVTRSNAEFSGASGKSHPPRQEFPLRYSSDPGRQSSRLSDKHSSHDQLQTGHASVIAKEGWLVKHRHILPVSKRCWVVLLGNCMYYYVSKSHTRPKGVIFLCGSFVEPVHSNADERQGHWGFEISRRVHGKESTKLFYTKSKADRDDWVLDLREASEANPIEEDYYIGSVLGKGRSSRVCSCVNKKTLERRAVKIIDKALVDDEEMDLVRSEISIMKLIDHPNIVHMINVYEGKHQVYIVMELYEHGALFDRIVGRSCFTEDEAYCITHPLMEAVEYLHDMGIVHRDLKPENILCGNDLTDIKIADFGLSMVIFPDEVMKLPCGTLSYVAPEVLTLSGYGKESDIWSIGTILYLLLCGGLPFDGETRKDIMSKTIAAKLDLDNPSWDSLSPDCQGIILGMLNKDTKKRLTATEALDHPWMSSRMET